MNNSNGSLGAPPKFREMAENSAGNLVPPILRMQQGKQYEKTITNTLQAMSFAETAIDESSIGSARFDDDLTDDTESSEEENGTTPLERFLTAWGLGEYLTGLEEQKIDLDTLMILTDNDLKSLNLPLGPYRKLVIAINERKSALENPGEVTDGML